MAEVKNYKAPGIYVEEIDNPSTKSDNFEGVDITTGAVVGYFKKGKIGTPILVTRDNFEFLTGGPIENAYGYYTLKGYFDNGADKAYVVRTAHYLNVADKSTLTAKSSKVTIVDKNPTDAKETFIVRANSEGVWGDKLSVIVYDSPLISTKLAKKAEAGDTTIVVNSLHGIDKGLMLKVGNSYFEVKEYSTYYKSITLDGTIGTELPVETPIVSNEFSIEVYYDSTLVEIHNSLDIRETSKNYFEVKVNNKSSYIEVEDKFSDSVYPANMPKSSDTVQYYLSGGDDGLMAVDINDLIGSKDQGTGMYAMMQTREAFRIWIAESSSEQIGLELDKFAKEYMYAFSVRTIPEGYSPAEAIIYRNEVGCFDSSYGALSYGWGWVDDPIGIGDNKPKKLVPLCGHLIGLWAKMNSDNNIATVPAGEEAVIRGVYSLDYQLDENEIGDLNVAGINCIIYLKGVGIVNWGARTLSRDKKWRYLSTRAIFEYVEKSIQEGTRWAVFQPTNKTTWNRLTMACNTFLNTVPGLRGDTVEERYSFLCDESNNPTDVRDNGQIISEVGLNIESIGEFIIFRVGHKADTTVITEEA